jgi:site-specific recombinase XerC
MEFKADSPKKTSISFDRVAVVRAIFDTALNDPVYGKWIPVLVLWYFCGIRFSEILKLKWKDIKWASNTVHISAAISKTKMDRDPFFSPAAGSLLIEYHGRVKPADDAPIVCDLGDMTTKRSYDREHTRFLTAFAAIRKDAGCEDEEFDNERRHSYGTYFLHYTGNLALTRRQMGTVKADPFQFYIALDVLWQEAAEFFCIGHPGSDPSKPVVFNPEDRWLTKKSYLSQAEAIDDVAKAVREEKDRAQFGKCARPSV